MEKSSFEPRWTKQTKTKTAWRRRPGHVIGGKVKCFTQTLKSFNSAFPRCYFQPLQRSKISIPRCFNMSDSSDVRCPRSSDGATPSAESSIEHMKRIGDCTNITRETKTKKTAGHQADDHGLNDEVKSIIYSAIFLTGGWRFLQSLGGSCFSVFSDGYVRLDMSRF